MKSREAPAPRGPLTGGRASGEAPEHLDLPADRPRSAAGTLPAGSVVRCLTGAHTAALLDPLCRYGGERSTLLLAVYQVLLVRSCRQRDLVVGVRMGGRRRREAAGPAGPSCGSVPVRLRLDGDPSFRELVGCVGEAMSAALAWGGAPPEEREPGARLPFRVVFALEEAPAGRRGVSLPEGEALEGEAAAGGQDLSLTLRWSGEGFTAALAYGTGLFYATTARRLLHRYENLLAGALAAPEQPVLGLPLLAATERQQVLLESNDTAAPYPRGASVHELFEGRAAASPEAVAVVFGEEAVSYGELNRRANRLACRLRAHGVGLETRVGLCVERSVAMVVGALGVLKAGGAYVPLDAGYPEERLAFMLQDVQAPVLVSTAPAAERVAPAAARVPGLSWVRLDEEGAAPAGADAGIPESGAAAENLAYVTYTSGSTGRPKGVSVLHRGVVRLVRGSDYAVLDRRQVLLQLAPISFDASTLEIWGALLNGGRLVMAPGQMPSLEELGAILHRRGVTTLWLTAGLFHQMVDENLEGLAPVEQLLAGGDVLSASHVRRVLAALPRCTLINGYGPTENTTFTSCWPMRSPGEVAEAVSIGRPIANGRVYILEPGLEPAGLGVPGELAIGGDGLARGYLRRPALTAERFVPDPFGPEPGGRLYRTGDLVRRRAGGELDFLGRLDHQVKLRGFRIELGEVEAALTALPAVREAVALVREDHPGDRRLVAYVVPGEAGLVPGDLAGELRRLLPAYMVPGAWVVLDALPLTPNGKVDRRSLPPPDAAAHQVGARGTGAPETGLPGSGAHEPPATPGEELMAGLWAEILHLERVGRHDDFFDLGGHSLLLTRLISHVRRRFGVQLTIQEVFEHPTLAAMARRITEPEGRGEGTPPLLPAEASQDLPLSFAQERLWFLDRLEPGSPVYNIPMPLELVGELDPEALGRSLWEIARRHQVLRTTFPAVEGRPVQRIQAVESPGSAWPLGHFRLPQVDLRRLDAAAAGREARRLMAAEARRPFDLLHGPVVRAALLRLRAGRWFLLLSFHHIAIDGWSLAVLARELEALYRAFRAGGAAALPELEVQVGDFAVWERRWLAGEVLEGQLDSWRRQLAGAPELLELPTDRPRPAVPTRAGERIPFHLAAAPAAELARLSRSEGATLFMVLLAAWQAVLGRHSGAREVVVGCPIAHRVPVETEALIGFFVNTLALRGDLRGDPGFRNLLARVRRASLAAFSCQDAPFERVVDALGAGRQLSHSPLFQVAFALQSFELPRPRLPGLEARWRTVHTGTAMFDLTLELTAGEEGIEGWLEYSTDLFDATSVRRLLASYGTLLEAVAADAGSNPFHLPLLSPAQAHQVLREWNDRGAPAGGRAHERGWVHQQVTEQALNRPHATAVVAGGETLSYGELVRRARGVAGRLAALGVGRGALVGLLGDRSPALVVGMLGILERGAAYLPLDPSYPEERLVFMLADAAVPVLMVAGGQRREAAARIAAGIPVLELGSAAPVGSGAGAGHLGDRSGPAPPALEAEDAAYVIYTSGSTGRPKGVVVPHGGLANLVAWFAWAFDLTSQDGVSQLASPSFDASVFEAWPPLAAGARLELVPAAARTSPEELIAWWAASRVSLSFAPTPLAEAVLRQGVPPGLGLRALQIAGDRLHALGVPPSPLDVYNLYGPTEASVATTWARADVSRSAPDPPIGRPLSNVQVYLLDRRGRPTPLGVPGELAIGGASVARGYLGRPALTARCFVPDPFAAAGARLYRTGDLVRWRPDGELDFLGRIDTQVKIRGFRVELGEIEAVLQAQPGVAAALAEVVPGPAGQRLVAYLVPRQGEEPPHEELLRRLAERLPDYMVPSVIIPLPELPLTPSGKVDRRALPRPEGVPRRVEPAPPQTPIEGILAAVWAEALGVERVGAGDDFFRLGGHSLLATRILARATRALGVELAVQDLFAHPTVAGLARVVEERRAAEAPPPIRPVPRGGALPLTFAQEQLWFLDRLEPGSALYNIPQALHLAGPLSPGALARSLAAVVRRHEVLRTTFPAEDGRPRQRIQPPPATPLPLPAVDLTSLAPEQRPIVAHELSRKEARRPFDLRRGPLLRAALLRLGHDEWRLLLNLHHIIADGWSMWVLVRELTLLYRRHCGGETAAPPELPVQFADFAVWQRRWLQGERLTGILEAWRRRLAGAPATLDLPTDRPRRGGSGKAGAMRCRLLPAALSREVDALARRRAATPFMVLLAAYQVLLARLSGARDLVVGFPVAGREREEVRNLMGFFVNSLPLRGDLRGDPDFQTVLERVRQAALEAYGQADVPFERLVEELQPRRDPDRSPVFQVMFALQSTPQARLELPGVELTPADVHSGTAKFDLTLFVEARGEAYLTSLEYATDLFDATTAGRFLGRFHRLLEAALAAPEGPVLELPLLAAAERHQLEVEWNDTAAAYPREVGLAALLARQVAARPHAVAVVYGDEHTSYGHLQRRAGALARRLRSSGVGLDTPVAMAAEPGPAAVAAMVGILRAGGAYVPLDASYPPSRLAFMLRDMGAPVLVMVGRGSGELAREAAEAGVTVLRLDEGGTVAGGRGEEAAAVASGAGGAEVGGRGADRGGADRGESEWREGVWGREGAADSLAYIIYTSGSTGRPKGVAVPQRAVARLVLGADYLALGAGDRVAQASNLSFDAATFEIWGPLLSGGCVVGIPKEISVVPAHLAAELGRRRVTALFLTTALFNQVVQEEPAAFASVGSLLFGGEACDPERVRHLLAGPAPPARLLHVYGPTESTTFASWQRVHGVAAGGTVPLGAGIANTRLHVLDGWLRPQPAAVPGELYIGGDGLARGYHGQARRTAESFVPDPGAGAAGRPAGDRLYRTGDRVRWLPAGGIEFLGRRDDQVKLRGFRIELGEIEVALAGHPGVAAAVVLVREDAPGDRRLVAYFVPAHPEGAPPRRPSTPRPHAEPHSMVDGAAVPAAAGGPTVEELKSHLEGLLPPYMVPGAFVRLDALPLTPNGKVDRKALPPPGADALGGGEDEPPVGEGEEQLAEIWAAVLKVERVGRRASFFDLGGHSLLATQVLSRIQQWFGVEVPVKELFREPTVAALAHYLREAGAEGRPDQAAPGEGMGPRPAPRDQDLPLSFAQERLWFFHRLHPRALTYNSSAAIQLVGSLSPRALAATFREIVRRHEVLRTRFEDHRGKPVQVISPTVRQRLPVVDLSPLSAGDGEAETRRLAARQHRRPFDLERGPLLRTTLLRRPAGEHLLLLSHHHVIFDGWSLSLFVREMGALYAAFSQGQPSPLPELPLQYADFAVWQRRHLAGPELDRQLAYWRELLAGAPPPRVVLPDHPPPAGGSRRRSGRVELALAPAATAALNRLARTHRATAFMVVLAAWQAVLQRHGDCQDVLTGTPIANRNRGEVEGLIGFFVNTLVLRGDFRGDPTVGALMEQIRRRALEAYAHQDAPFEKVVEAVGGSGGAGEGNLFQALFVLQNVDLPRLELPGLEVRYPSLGEERPPLLDLVCGLAEVDGELRGGLEYDADLFDATTVRRLGEHFLRLLRAFPGAVERPVSALPLLSAAERQQLVVEWGRAGAGAPWVADLPELEASLPAAARGPGALRALYLLDRFRQPVPLGSAGTLHGEVAGAGELPPPAPRAGGQAHLLPLGIRRRHLPEGRLAPLSPGPETPQAGRATAEPQEAEEAMRRQVGERRSRLSSRQRALLARRLRGARAQAAQAPPSAIPRRPPGEPAVASFAQVRLWFLDQLEPARPTYNMPFSMLLRGRFDPAALGRCLGEILRRHEVLRWSFTVDDAGEPRVEVAPLPPPATLLPRVDLSALPLEPRRGAARALARREAARPFSLARGPLVRSVLLSLAPDHHVLLWTAHHIVFDGWSAEVVTREIGALYGAFAAGRPSPLPKLVIGYGDFAYWQRQRLQGPVLEEELAYWRRRLAGAPPLLELPTDRPRPPVQNLSGGRCWRQLPPALATAVRVLAREEEATPFVVLLAAFHLLLGRLAGTREVVVGTPIAGRNRAETEGLVGLFVNTLALRAELSGSGGFRALVAQVRETALGAYAHQELPFEKLVEDLHPQRSLSYTPIFQVFFNFGNLGPPGAGDASPGAGALQVDLLEPPEVYSKFDLTLYAQESQGGVRLDLVYSTDLFDGARMEEMLRQYEALLTQATAAPDEPVGTLSLLTDEARSPLPDPAASLPPGRYETVVERFFARAGERPEAAAVVDPEETRTYGALAAGARRVAAALAAAGVGVGDVVALTGERSGELVEAVLGVLGARAAFLLLDPAYPAERRAAYVRRARPRAWLAAGGAAEPEPAVAEALDEVGCSLRLSRWWGAAGTAPPPVAGGVPSTGPAAGDLAYVAFTSGSTGEPKGVLGTHRPLSHFLHWHTRTFGLGADDRFSLFSGLAHDPVLRDLFTPLWLGASLHIPEPGQLPALAEWMARHAVTASHLTPAMGQVLIASAGEGIALPALHHAFFAGEVLCGALVGRMRRLAPAVAVANFYGATETPQAMAFETVGPEAPAGPLPLGRGIDGVQLLVCSREGQLAGVGELGEIFIRTPYLASGYLGPSPSGRAPTSGVAVDEALTRERFLANPWTGRDGDRLYRTGDLGRYLPDGRVSFAGRADAQLKIRGFRVEPGEVEAALEGHPGLEEAAVGAWTGGDGQMQLFAWIVPSGPEAPEPDELQAFLTRWLPDFMVPAAFIKLPELPRTPNGKVDRRALPIPEGAAGAPVGSGGAPRDRLEHELAGIWEEVLGRSPVGVEDDFFALGGHSLLAVRLLSQIRHRLGRRLPLAALFEAPTVAAQARRLRGSPGTGPPSPLLTLQPGGSRPPLFLVHPAGGTVLCYRPLARLLGNGYPLYALEAPGLEPGTQPLAGIPALAARYLAAVREQSPRGPYHLAGWSFGGFVAFEMAQQLRREGEEVGLLALLDSNARLLGRDAGLEDGRLVAAAVAEIFPRTAEAVSGLAPEEALARAVERAREAGLLPPGFGAEDAGRFLAVLRSNVGSYAGYSPRPYPGRITLFRAGDDPAAGEDPSLGWDDLATGGLRVVPVPGRHGSLLSPPHVDVLAWRLREALEKA